MALFTKNSNTKGFTLVEMVVVAPIIILAIGAFIAVIINLTGEVLSSRGSNSLTYDVQDALNRIETDVKLSATTLATNSISLTGTNQGFVADGQATPGGSTVNFSNISTGGSPASLILNVLATNGNPLSDTTTYLYLKDTPNSCADPALYTKNTPLTTNVVYYIANDTLWRRTIMPENYATAANLCGGTSWQRPSCLPGYTNSFCTTNDEKLIEGITPADFAVSYYTSASATTPIAAATTGTDAARGIALQGAQMIKVSLTAKKTIAGRDIQRSGTVQVTRLDTNASGIATDSTPTAVPPTAPMVSSSVTDGHVVKFTWNQVPTASSYDISYRVNSGAAVTASVDNNNRSYSVSAGNHGDTVSITITPRNAVGPGASGTTSSVVIPIWAPLILKGSWSDFGSSFTTAAYTKTRHGIVMVKGLVKNPSSPAGGSVIAQLPSDYKPTGRMLFSTTTSGDSPAPIDVDQNGTIYMGTGGAGGWYALDSISFIAASTPTSNLQTARTNLTLSNGFTNLSGYAPATYARDLAGRVSIQGTLNAGTRTDGTVISTLPSTILPQYFYSIDSRAGSGFHYFGIAPSANGAGLVAKGATPATGLYSITSRYYPSGSYPAGATPTWTALTMQNGWVSFGAPNSALQYTKASDNIVQLRGMIKSGTTTAGTTVATLPAGARPKQRIILAVPNNGAHARIDIHPTGIITITGTSNAWASFDNVSFLAEQ